MVYSSYLKQRILHFYLKGHRAHNIRKLLLEENVKASQVGIASFLKKLRRLAVSLDVQDQDALQRQQLRKQRSWSNKCMRATTLQQFNCVVYWWLANTTLP